MPEEAIRKIEAQQPKKHNAVWGVGEQLKDILRHEPRLAEIVAQDLENKAMSLAECEKKIKARADELHKGGSGAVCITPMEAEEIIRKFYGLPEKDTSTALRSARYDKEEAGAGEVVSLEEFF